MCTRQRLKRVADPENTTSDGMCAVVEQYITNQVVILDVAGPDLTFPSRRFAAVKQYSANRAATPGVVGPERTILESACAVLVKYGSSQLAVPGVVGPRLTMPNRKPVVVESYTAVVGLAAAPNSSMTIGTYAVVVWYGVCRVAIPCVAGFMPMIMKGIPAVVGTLCADNLVRQWIYDDRVELKHVPHKK